MFIPAGPEFAARSGADRRHNAPACGARQSPHPGAPDTGAAAQPPPVHRLFRVLPSAIEPRLFIASWGQIMKPDTHPDYHTIKVVMTDGTEFTTRTDRKSVCRERV